MSDIGEEDVIYLGDEEEEEEDDDDDMVISEGAYEKTENIFDKNINISNEDINKEIREISEYLEQSIKDFHKLFNKNLNNFDDALKYLESISISNNCVCAGIIKNIPAWRCNDCCEYESAIYCSNCYRRSKHLHKDHKVYYLYSSGGMCDCGDPDSLSTFCPQHCGPYSEQSEIDQFISKVFSQEIITNLTKFFDEFFLKFSKFFVLMNNNKCDMIEEKVVFQKLINFFKTISNKNSGMFHLLSKYFLKNHFKDQIIEDKYKTTHSCLKINKNDIEILYKKENNINKMEIENDNNENSSNKHICECNFMRLFFLNWSCEDINKKKETEEFIMKFTSIFPLKKEYCITLFYDYEHFILNNYASLLNVKTQFFSEEITIFIAEKTTFIEDSFEIFYNYFSKKIKSNNSRNDLGVLRYDEIKRLYRQSYYKEDDIEYFSKPKIRELVGKKVSIIKRIIDCICLIHNELEFESFYPHPEYQNKGFNDDLVDLESKLLSIIEKLSNMINWKDSNLTKDIFQYIINKITNQEKEGIKQLKENEYSYHLILYRCFGILLNYFCYYNSLENNCTIIESIKYFKSNLFKNQNEINLFVELIINDYYKLFGFIGGGKNGFFKYYGNIDYYFVEYFYIKNLLKMDFTLLKYLFIMTENNFSLISLLQKSNLENVFASFKDIFLDNNNNTNNEQMMNIDSNINDSIINQWKFILELIIIFIKNDSSPFWTFMREYENVISSKTKKDLFENVKKNNNAMDDLENILKEQIIHIIVAQGNLSDIEKIKKHIDDYLITLFGEKKFNEILDELTFNKTDKGKKMFYLKDSNLKYLDMNYYIYPKDKSNAQKYILDFKKDIIKPYNNYFYSPSQLSFDFFENVYEKVLLNKDNLNTIIIILQKLLSNSNEIKDINSMRNIILPVALNYLSIFGCINTKSFIDFKKENSILIDNANQILSSSIENKLIDRDIEEYIKDIIEQLNRYKILIDNNISPKEYDYNTNSSEILNLLNKNGKSIDKQNNDINNEKKLKSKNIKEHLKNLMKDKAQNFMNKAKLDDKTLKAINEKSTKEDINNDSKDEIMCFFCRNTIKLNSFTVPYGKAGYLLDDYFYINSIKSTVKSELTKLKKIIVDDKIKWISVDNIDDSDNTDEETSKRIISCSHYFHQSCFKENFHIFVHYLNCPLCLKKTNLLIPPLNNFKNEYSFLKSENINKIFNRKTKIKKNDTNKDKKEAKHFSEIIFDFLRKITSFDLKTDKISANNFDFFIDDIFLNFKSYINFLENIFYVEGTYFNKYQQINIIKNYILSLRYLVNNNIVNINNILKNINDILNSLMKGPGKFDSIISNYENMHYINCLEKLLLYLSILFDFNEMKSLFKYIINLILPYFSFGFYLRNLIIKNDFYSLYNNKTKEIINYKNINQYFTKNNKYMINNCFNFILQKFLIIRIITDYDSTNEDILNNFNNLSIEKMLSLIGIDNLYKSISKNKNNQINFNDIFKELPKLFKSEEVFFKQYSINHKIIFESIVNNIHKKKKEDKYLVKKELFVHFSPLKFDFINLDDNIFDLVEKNLERKCIACSEITRHFYICLICGNKICKNNNEYSEHIKNCSRKYCIFLDMANMEISIFSKSKFKTLYPLYVNDAGVGPSSSEIGNEFKLSKEKLSLTLRTFICNDFNLK